MASAIESRKSSSVAGCAVTLPKNGLAAEEGLGVCAQRVTERPTTARPTRNPSVVARRTECCARSTLFILSDGQEVRKSRQKSATPFPGAAHKLPHLGGVLASRRGL